MVGICTQVFRSAKNGAEVLERIRNELGIKVSIVPQNLEGILGFRTVLASSKVYSHPSEVLSWDSGGASFQLADEFNGGVRVFEGPLGSSVVTRMMVEDVQNKSFKLTQTANPATPKDSLNLLDRIIELIPTPPDWLIEKIKNQKTSVIAFGGDTCVFRLCALYFAEKKKRESGGKEKEKEEEVLKFTPEMVREVLTAFTEKTDQQLSHLPQPEMAVPKLALILGVVTRLGIREFHYCFANGCTSGVLVSADLIETLS